MFAGTADCAGKAQERRSRVGSTNRRQGSLLSLAGRIIGRPDFSLRVSHLSVVIGSGSIPETFVLPERSERGVAGCGVDEWFYRTQCVFDVKGETGRNGAKRAMP